MTKNSDISSNAKYLFFIFVLLLFCALLSGCDINNKPPSPRPTGNAVAPSETSEQESAGVSQNTPETAESLSSGVPSETASLPSESAQTQTPASETAPEPTPTPAKSPAERLADAKTTVNAYILSHPGSSASLCLQKLDIDRAFGYSSEQFEYYIDSTDIKHCQIDPALKSKIEKFGGIVEGDSSKPYVYLTVNLGASAMYGTKILNFFREENIKATFFMLEEFCVGYDGNAKTIFRDGHLIATHGLKHCSIPAQPLGDAAINIAGLADVLTDYYGAPITTKFFRPPSGSFCERDLELARQMGMVPVFWTFTYEDYLYPCRYTRQECYDFLCGNLRNGAIYQLHIVNETSVNALIDFIKYAKSQGYQFKTLEALYE